MIYIRKSNINKVVENLKEIRMHKYGWRRSLKKTFKKIKPFHNFYDIHSKVHSPAMYVIMPDAKTNNRTCDGSNSKYLKPWFWVLELCLVYFFLHFWPNFFRRKPEKSSNHIYILQCMQLKKILKRRVQIPNYYKNFSIFQKQRRILKRSKIMKKSYVIAMHDNQNYTNCY